MKKYFLSIPKMGESIEQATISKWHVKEGDILERDQTFIEISTDKVESEIPSPFKCKILKILIHQDNITTINTPIADVELLEDYEIINDSSQKTKVDTSNENISQTKSQFSNTSVQLSPVVKEIFLDSDVLLDDIKNIIGTGHNGRITKNDALNFVKNKSHFSKKRNFIQNNSEVNIENRRSKYKTEILDIDSEVPFDRMRNFISDHMLDSISLSAHCTTFIDIDVSEVVEYRDKVKDDYFKKFNSKITYTHIFIYILIDALKNFPTLNSLSTQNGYVLKKNLNIGFAAALPNDNLIVPVLKESENLTFENLVKKVNELALMAKTNQLTIDNIQNGTFTISNTGIFGSLMGTPIINQPQVAIMSLGQINRIPSVILKNDKEEIAIRSKMYVSLSYDHRIIDGAYASKFLSYFKNGIQNFEEKILF